MTLARGSFHSSFTPPPEHFRDGRRPFRFWFLHSYVRKERTRRVNKKITTLEEKKKAISCKTYRDFSSFHSTAGPPPLPWCWSQIKHHLSRLVAAVWVAPALLEHHRYLSRSSSRTSTIAFLPSTISTSLCINVFSRCCSSLDFKWSARPTHFSLVKKKNGWEKGAESPQKKSYPASPAACEVPPPHLAAAAPAPESWRWKEQQQQQWNM